MDKFLHAENRLDPFHSGFWTKSSAQAVWVAHPQVMRQVKQGLAYLEAPWQMSEEEALDVLTRPRYRNQVVGVLGALMQWRTCTGQQLAAICGVDALASQFRTKSARSRVLTALWTLDLIEYGRVVSGAWVTQPRHAPLLYRPASVKAFEKIVAPLLTRAELTAVTGGSQYSSFHQFDRHNVLSTELALRFCEFCEAGTVVGEALSTFDHLSFGRWTRLHELENKSVPANMADLVLVRADGLRVAVELTASGTTPGLKAKIFSWARLLQHAPFEDTGLVVLFLEAAPPFSRSISAKKLGVDLRTMISKAINRFPGTRQDLTSDRMFVTSWTSLFPTSSEPSPNFALLKSDKALGTHPQTWCETNLMDIFDLPLPVGVNPQLPRVVANSLSLAGTPALIGRAHPTFRGVDSTSGSLQALGGLPQGMQVVSSRPGKHPARNPQTGNGAVTQSLLPSRLVWAPHSQVGPPPVV